MNGIGGVATELHRLRVRACCCQVALSRLTSISHCMTAQRPARPGQEHPWMMASTSPAVLPCPSTPFSPPPAPRPAPATASKPGPAGFCHTSVPLVPSLPVWTSGTYDPGEKVVLFANGLHVTPQLRETWRIFTCSCGSKRPREADATKHNGSFDLQIAYSARLEIGLNGVFPRRVVLAFSPKFNIGSYPEN